MQTLLLDDGRTIFEEKSSEAADQNPQDLKDQAFKEIEEFQSSKDILMAEIEKSRRMIILLVSLLISLSIVFIGLFMK